jgi:hypothetical protein
MRLAYLYKSQRASADTGYARGEGEFLPSRASKTAARY